MRTATLVAAVLVAAGAGMAAVGLAAGGGGGEERSAARPTPTPTAGSVRGGRAVWVAQGCGSCHRLTAAGSTGDIGPDLDALSGAPVSYIRTSIVDPAAAAAPGFSPGAMPEDYASRISPAELERLVAFIAGRAR